MSVGFLLGPIVVLAAQAVQTPAVQTFAETPGWTTPLMTVLATLIIGFGALGGTRFKGRTEVSEKFRVRVFGAKAKLHAGYFQPEFRDMFRDVIGELASFDLPPGEELPDEALDAVVGRAEWAARVTRLNAWLTQETDLDRFYARLKLLQGLILLAFGLLATWCLVGELILVALLVSGRLSNDWVVFVAGSYGALFLSAVVFALGIFALAHNAEARLVDTLDELEGRQ